MVLELVAYTTACFHVVNDQELPIFYGGLHQIETSAENNAPKLDLGSQRSWDGSHAKMHRMSVS